MVVNVELVVILAVVSFINGLKVVVCIGDDWVKFALEIMNKNFQRV